MINLLVLLVALLGQPDRPDLVHRLGWFDPAATVVRTYGPIARGACEPLFLNARPRSYRT